MEELEMMGGGVEQAPLMNYPEVNTVQPATPPAEPVDEGIQEPAAIPKAEDKKEAPPTFSPKPWSEVESLFKENFPNLDPKMMEKKYNIAQKLAETRAKYAGHDMATGAVDTITSAIPFAGPLARTVREDAYKDAVKRIQEGNPIDENHPNYNPNWAPTDYEIVAQHENDERARSERGLMAHVGIGTAGALRFTAEQMAAGTVGKALGLGARAAQALGLGVAAGEGAVEASAVRASGKDDDSRFYSPSNIIPSASMAGIQALILHGAGQWTQGIEKPLTKIAADIGVQFPAMQGTEIAAGALDEFLAPAWKTNTQYGVIGKILQGHQGEALKETVSEVLTIAALSALHSGKGPMPKRLIELITSGIDEAPQGRAKPGAGEPPPGGNEGETRFSDEATRRRYEEAKKNYRKQGRREETWEKYEREQEEAFQRRQRNRTGQDQAADNLRKKVDATAEEILGVKPDATMDEITRAYRKRSMESHPDRGGTSDEFQWVDWAYKTLQARAGRGKGPRSRPRSPYEPRQQTPYEGPNGERPEQPQEPTAKTAASDKKPGRAQEAPPSPPGEETPARPTRTTESVPEPVPEEVKTRLVELQGERNRARFLDDFQAETESLRNISRLLKDYPRLASSEALSVAGMWQEPIQSGPQLPEMSPQQIASQPWLGRDMGEMSKSPASRILARMRERQAGRMGRPREQTAPAAARPPRTWVGEVHDEADLLPTIDQLHEIKGLTPQEKHLMARLFNERVPFAKLVDDPIIGLKTGGGIHKMSVRILNKLGYEGTVEDFFDQAKEEVVRTFAENGIKLEHGALGANGQKAEAVRKKVMNRVTKEEARLKRWSKYIAELEQDGPLSGPDRESIGESISKGEQPPGYGETKRGKKLAAKLAAKSAPVPAGPGESVPKDTPPKPAAKATGLSKAETMRRGRAVPKEFAAEAERMGIDVESLHAGALEVARLDREHHSLVLGALQLARKTSKGLGFVDLTNFKQRAGKSGFDATKLPGFDVVAYSVAKAYPELFKGGATAELGYHSEQLDWVDTLFEMLSQGNPVKMTEREAYEIALKRLSDMKEATRLTPERIEEVNDEFKKEGQAALTEAEVREVEQGAVRESLSAESERVSERLPGDEEEADGPVDESLFDDSFNVDEFGSGPGSEPDAASGISDAGSPTGDAGSSGIADKLSQISMWARATPLQRANLVKHARESMAENGMTSQEAVDWINEAAKSADSYFREYGQPDDFTSLDQEGAANWQDRFADTPPGTQTNFLPGSFGSLVGEQREMFDRTPIERPKTYEGFADQRNFIDEAERIAKNFLGDEGGAIDLDQVVRAARYAKDGLNRLSGKMVPTTTRANRETGEALAQWYAADQYGREAGELYAEILSGRNATTADRIKDWSMLTEMRLGYMRDAYRRLGSPANVAAAKQAAQRARVALRAGIKLKKQTARAAAGKPPGSPERQTYEQVKRAVRAAKKVAQDLEKKYQTIKGYDAIANGVRSTIGKPGTPFATAQDYFAALASPRGREVQRRWQQEILPAMESIFRRAMGLNATDPIKSFTQIPDMAIPLKPIKAGDLVNRPGMVMMDGSKGPKRLIFKKYKRALTAKGNAAGYDLDPERVLGDVFGSGARLAAQANFARVAVKNGQALWARPGQHVDGYKEVPFTSPPKGTQLGSPGQVLYVKDEIHGEVMRGFDSDTPETAVKVIRMLNNLPMMANLASFVDAASHGLNLGLALTMPAGKWGGMMRNTFNVVHRKLKHDPEIQKALLELTRVAANKPHHAGEGMIVGAAQKVADWTGKTLPEGAKKARYVDPTYYLSHAIDQASDIVRLALSEAFNQQVKNGLVEDTETNRRDFINQATGQYNAKGMNWLARLFRQTGFGPFVVAGTTMNARAIKALVGGTGLPGNGWKSEARLRRDFILKLLAGLGVGMAWNYARWGRVDGDDNTPRFGIKIGEAEDGKTVSLPNPVGMLLNRGMRSVPFLSYLVDSAIGTSPPGETEDKIYDFADAWMHPFAGPTIQFIHTAWTGKDAMGKKIAAPAGEDSSEPRENLKAAFKQANPVYSALAGAYKPGEEIPLSERLAKLMGPFGFRHTEKQPSELAHLYDLGHRIREVHNEARRSAKKEGKMAPTDVRLNVIQRAETAIGKLERARHAPGLTQEKRQEIRAREVRIAKQALEAAERLRKYSKAPGQ